MVMVVCKRGCSLENVVIAKYVVNKLARAEAENFIWGGRGPPSSMYEIRVCVCP